jgi:small subunit ribosomal protein S29
MSSTLSEQQPLQDRTSRAPTMQEATQQLMYSQPKLTAELLRRVAKSNEKVLKSLTVAHTHDLGGGHRPKDLHSLSSIGAQNPALSWPVWQSLWKELTSPSPQRRPPVLFTVDGIDHWMALSKYMSADYKPIHAHQLAPIRHFLDVLFNKDGAGKLANGGIVLAATTGSNIPAVPTLDLLLRQVEARERGLKIGDEGFPMPGPYKAVDQRVLGLFPGSDGLNIQRLKGLERDVEARGLLEYYARSGVMREAVGPITVAEKWSLSGGGVIGELARFGKRLKV